MTPYPTKVSPMIPAVLLILSIACWAEMDLFVPSLPQMVTDFGTTDQTIQLTLSLNFLGFFISSLFCGAMADAFGRRPVLIGGSILFVIGGCFCVFSTHIVPFLIGRFIQGIGVSGPATVTTAVIGDLYEGDRQMKLQSLMNSIITITMALAPLVGVAIAVEFGWRANFGVIAILAVVGLVAASVVIPETLPVERRRALRVKDLIATYKLLLFSREFVLPVVGLCALITPYFIFIGVISLLFIGELNLPMSEYVFYQGSVVGVFALFSLLMPLLPKRTNMNRLSRISIWISLIAGLGPVLSFSSDP